LRRTLRLTRRTLRLAFLLALRFLAFLLTAIVRPFSADELSRPPCFRGQAPSNFSEISYLSKHRQ
jgi:hypothetical protein